MDKYKHFTELLVQAENRNLKRSLKNIIPISARECLVNNRKCINFSANNYLGIADHPFLKERAIQWTEKYGTGSSASRLVTGTYEPYLELEQQIADWKKTEAALLFGSGYMANIGIISAVTDKSSIIFADKLNHASLNAGSQLADAKFLRYRHNDMFHLEKLLTKHSEIENKIIISDTVFSMDGDIAPLAELKQLAEQYNTLLYLDDAHATGVFGDKGEGLAIGHELDFAMGTFSKAMGSYGAYIACSKIIKDYLINRCGSFIYTTALPPAVYGAISAAVELVQSKEYCEIRRKLLETSRKLICEFRNSGLNTGQSQSPIIPIILGDADHVLQLSQHLLNNGILAVAIRPPTVPEGSARIRISINTSHTDNDINFLLDKICEFRN